MIVKTNIASINANRVNKFHQEDMNTTFRNLSSGKRINRAGDDASGYAITERMTGQIVGLNRAERNAMDGLSFLQTTEGYLSQTSNILTRMRELSVQAANGVNSSEDRVYLNIELTQLVSEVDRLANYAEFNGLELMKGKYQEPQTVTSLNAPNVEEMYLHVGANANQRIQLFVGDMTAEGLNLRDANGEDAITFNSIDTANQAISVVDKAMQKVHKQFADIGAVSNRLGSVTKSLAIGSENLQAARSRIRDANMAEEVSTMVRNQILSQTQAATISQANQSAQAVLQLLQ